jgi:predicted CopG family antitoxin
MSTRHTINLNHQAYKKLNGFGRFGESYSELVLRLLEMIGNPKGEENE